MAMIGDGKVIKIILEKQLFIHVILMTVFLEKHIILS
jgi:hypothetical protein